MPVDWVAPSVVLMTLTMTLGLWRWMVAALREVKDEQVRMDGALLGYKGQGGALADIEALKRECATVDDRITKSRHEVRNAIQIDIMKLEEGIYKRFADFERHLDQRLADLGVRRREP